MISTRIVAARLRCRGSDFGSDRDADSAAGAPASLWARGRRAGAVWGALGVAERRRGVDAGGDAAEGEPPNGGDADKSDGAAGGDAARGDAARGDAARGGDAPRSGGAGRRSSCSWSSRTVAIGGSKTAGDSSPVPDTKALAKNSSKAQRAMGSRFSRICSTLRHSPETATSRGRRSAFRLMFFSSSRWSRPEKGGSPASISKSTAPTLHRSALAS